jgi:hypothetical protein
MANQIEILVKANADGAKKAFGSLTEQVAANRKKIGIGLTGIGAGITGLAVLSIKAAQEEAIGISRLDQALKNVGASYDSNKKSIEAVISATQAKTNFGDEEQRDILTKLVTVLGDEKQALEALPAVLDASAASGKSAGSVAETMSKFLAGLTNNSDAVGVSVDKSATFTERLGRVMDAVGGQAEAAADPFTQFKNRTGDLSQEFGRVLLPILEKVTVILEKVTQKVIEFTQAHPNLTKWLAIGVAAFGAIALVVGPLLLILPGLAVGFTAVGVAVNLAMGPVGLIILAIAALAAGAILLWKNWDTVWAAIKKTVQTVGNFVIGIMNKLTLIQRKVIGGIIEGIKTLVGVASKLPFVGDKFDGVQEALEGVQDRLDRGIPKIDFAGDKMDELGSDFEKAGHQVERANQGMGDSTTDMAGVVEIATRATSESTRIMAEDMATAWGEVEDVMMGVAIKHKEALDEQAFNQSRHDALMTLSSESRKSQFKQDQEDFMERMRAQGKVYDGMLDSTEQYYDRVAKAAEESASRVEVAAKEGLDKKFQNEFSIPGIARRRPAGEEPGNAPAAVQISAQNAVMNRANVIDQLAGVRFKLANTPWGHPKMSGDWETRKSDLEERARMLSGQVQMYTKQIQGLGFSGAFARGGIVTRPTIGLIGEAGPEAVIPLGRGGGMGSMNVTVNIAEGAVVGVDDLQDTIAQTVRDTAERGGFRGVF